MRIDPVTLMPIDGDKKAKDEKKERFDRQYIDTADSIVSALNTKSGEILIKHIKSILFKRAEDLVKDDPECMGLVKLLRELGVRIKIGEEISKKMVKEAVNK
jgi:hypothetical protein